MNSKKNIALISGGQGYEHDVSEMSAENLFSLIDKGLYSVFLVHINKDGNWYISQNECKKYIKFSSANDFFCEGFPVRCGGTSGVLSNGNLIPIDCAIPCLHGNFGEDGSVQGTLSTAGIAYIGQDVYASAMTSDKIYTKLAAERLNIPTARWIFSDGSDCADAKRRANENLAYPLFIKPARLGSSYGAHPIFSESEFESAFEDSRKYDSRILIEELVEFDHELECALFDNGKRVIFPGGKVLSGGTFYDFDSKYTAEMSPKTEAKTDAFTDAEKKAAEYSNALAALIGIRHLSRFDFFVTKDDKIIFNEINAFPGMTETSLYPKLVSKIGNKNGDFINLLIDKVCSYDRRI